MLVEGRDMQIRPQAVDNSHAVRWSPLPLPSTLSTDQGRLGSILVSILLLMFNQHQGLAVIGEWIVWAEVYGTSEGKTGELSAYYNTLLDIERLVPLDSIKIV